MTVISIFHWTILYIDQYKILKKTQFLKVYLWEMSEDKLPFVWSACLIIYNVALIQLKQTPQDTFYPNVCKEVHP